MPEIDNKTYIAHLDLVRQLAAAPLPGQQVLVTGGRNKGETGRVTRIGVSLRITDADGKTFRASINNISPSI